MALQGCYQPPAPLVFPGPPQRDPNRGLHIPSPPGSPEAFPPPVPPIPSLDTLPHHMLSILPRSPLH
nr:hypothetical protein Itr_chr06CG13120 [Ipomoea trifida]